MSQIETPKTQAPVLSTVDSGYLHFVGGHLYTSQRFIAESKQLGSVQRAAPFYVLKKMKFGTVVFVAEPKKASTVDGAGKLGLEHSAVIFGYFRITGMSNTVPKEIMVKVLEKLNVVRVGTQNGKRETRACGGYNIGDEYVVLDDLPTIMAKIEEECKSRKVDPRSFQYFARGELQTLQGPIIIHDRKFFRGFSQIKLPAPVDITPYQKDRPTEILQIFNYTRRKYLNKKAKSVIDQLLLAEFTKDVKSQ